MEQLTASLPLAAPLLPNPSLLSDYIPFIVGLVKMDDQQQGNFDAAMAESKANHSSPPPLPGPIRAGTRRSRRLNSEYAETYERNLELPSDVLEIARSLRLSH